MDFQVPLFKRVFSIEQVFQPNRTELVGNTNASVRLAVYDKRHREVESGDKITLGDVLSVKLLYEQSLHR